VKQTIQDQLIASIQNLKILIRKAGLASKGLITRLNGLLATCHEYIFELFNSMNQCQRVPLPSPCHV
jgi:hypothetical protein